MISDPIVTEDRESARAGETIRVDLLFFGAAREIVGAERIDQELARGTRASDARALIFQRYPELERRFGRSLMFAVNQEYALADRVIDDGDELALFPPVSGGGENANSDFFELTTEPIDVGAVARRVVRNECGATVTLDGYVREWTKGRRSLYLIYEAYDQMALNEMKRLGREAHEQFEIAHLGIVHRLGRLEIGETSVVVTVGAPHRKSAFAACEWAIRELKRTVPIWKKEFYEDGSMWVEGEGAPVLADPPVK